MGVVKKTGDRTVMPGRRTPPHPPVPDCPDAVAAVNLGHGNIKCIVKVIDPATKAFKENGRHEILIPSQIGPTRELHAESTPPRTIRTKDGEYWYGALGSYTMNRLPPTPDRLLPENLPWLYRLMQGVRQEIMQCLGRTNGDPWTADIATCLPESWVREQDPFVQIWKTVMLDVFGTNMRDPKTGSAERVPERITILPEATAAWLGVQEIWGLDRTKTWVVVDLGSYTCDIVSMENQGKRDHVSYQQGVRNGVVEPIIQYLGRTYQAEVGSETVESLLRGGAFSWRGKEHNVEPIVHEIAHTWATGIIHRMRQHLLNKHFDGIVLAGGGACLKGVQDAFREETMFEGLVYCPSKDQEMPIIMATAQGCLIQAEKIFRFHHPQ